MANDDIKPALSWLLRFYARCFVYPYDEMTYELQYLFRELEQFSAEEILYEPINQVLNIINSFQGEEQSELRQDYVKLFTASDEERALCPLVAGDFLRQYGKHYEAEDLYDLFFDAGLPFDESGEVDTIINILEYNSLLIESGAVLREDEFFENHVQNWVPMFCDVLYRASNVNFYKEVAGGLKDLLLILSEY